MAMPSMAAVQGIDVNNVITLGQYLQLSIPEFHDLTLRQLASSPLFGTTVINSTGTADREAVDRFQLAFGRNTTIEKAQAVVSALPTGDACIRGELLVATLTAVSLIMLYLRILSKKLAGLKLRWDDHFCWMAFVVIVISQALEIADCNVYHTGLHAWDIKIDDYRNVLLFGYIIEMTYYPNLCLIKLSFLVFYHHLFRAYPKLQLVCKLLGVLLVLGNSVVLVGVFQYQPINYWDHILDAVPTFDRYAFFRSVSYIAISTDFIVLALPFFILPKSNLKFKEKFLVAGLFIIGAFACIASVIRFLSLRDFSLSADWSYAATITATWSIIEIHLAIFCSCIPSLRSLLVRYSPRLKKLKSSMCMSTTEGASKGTFFEIHKTDVERGLPNVVLSKLDEGKKWSKSKGKYNTMTTTDMYDNGGRIDFDAEYERSTADRKHRSSQLQLQRIGVLEDLEGAHADVETELRAVVEKRRPSAVTIANPAIRRTSWVNPAEEAPPEPSPPLPTYLPTHKFQDYQGFDSK